MYIIIYEMKKRNKDLEQHKEAWKDVRQELPREIEKTSKWIGVQTRFQDIIKQVKIKKWRWVGHLTRTKDNRLTEITTEWRPMTGSRSRERQKKWIER